MKIYNDADWTGSIQDWRSTFGYCSYVWGNLVTWLSKKQSVVSRNSAEVEFRAMANGFYEGIWLRRLLLDLKINVEKPIKVPCDNQSAISIAKNLVHHDQTKHVKIDRHFIKEKLEEGVFLVIYTPTNSQIADILTKALPRKPFKELSCKPGLNNIFSPTWGGVWRLWVWLTNWSFSSCLN